jgi:phenazine biosynthesis protein phzE
MSWFEQITGLRPPPFALIHRPGFNAGAIDLILGRTSAVDRIADIPLPPEGGTEPRHDMLAILPYRQIRERGFDAPDDDAPWSPWRWPSSRCSRWPRCSARCRRRRSS